ncbi:MAG: substrate-binding domain-containing protein [Verrucomicrobia bacterium]|nr:substrate-binding domain-containing protein [Verrucomicrobiota bacterium]
MRIHHRSLFGLALAALSCVSLPAAGPKVGVLLKGRSPFWASMEQGALEAGRKGGAEVVVKAPLTESDVAVQVQLLNAMAAQGFAAIVIAPANKDALAAPVAALAAKGIKIVVLESPLEGASAPVFVGTDHTLAGEAAGSLLATLVGDADEVSFLNHSQTNSATLAREKGAMAKFRAARPKNVVHADIYASAEAGAEIEKARLLLERYPATKAVFASGTGGTLAMLKVLEEKKLAGTVKLVGFGFNLSPEVAAALAAGKMHGWIAWQPRELGARGVETALALVAGEKVPAVVNTDFAVVTPANVKDAKMQALAGQ